MAGLWSVRREASSPLVHKGKCILEISPFTLKKYQAI